MPFEDDTPMHLLKFSSIQAAIRFRMNIQVTYHHFRERCNNLGQKATVQGKNEQRFEESGTFREHLIFLVIDKYTNMDYTMTTESRTEM